MTTCPLDPGWRLWTMFHYRHDRVPSEAALNAQGVRAGAVVETLHPAWEIADDDASRMPMTTEESKDVPWRLQEGSPWHVHAEFPVGADVVHVDVCGACRFAPSSFWREARTHVNGELRGRGGACGCSLGGGGNDEPATALVVGHLLEVSLIGNRRRAGGRPLIRVLLRRIA
jgi:hypothetical protein